MKRWRSVGWDEIRVRGSQEFSKHWDWLRYRFHGTFTTREVGAVPTPIPGGPRFFFSPADLPELIARFRERFPSEAAATVRNAEQICKHEFSLLGLDRLSFGPAIDWHLDLVHGKRAPQKPWFRIRCLDFDEVGDAKIIWELNRHQHWIILAKAYRLTNREEFAAELFAQWAGWQQQNPYPIGINWASSLEVAFRSIAWLWVAHLLAGSPVVSPEFSRNLRGQLEISGRHIERYLSTYFSPNTHLLGEGLALFFIGTLCPVLPAAARWQAKGWRILLDGIQNQVRADGMYFEQSTYYHVYALDFFLHARILADCNGLSVPLEFDRKLEAMLEFLAALARVGVVPRLGDDDGGRLFDHSRNHAEHLPDPLSTGAALFQRPDWKAAAGPAREETLWLLGSRGLQQFDSLTDSPAPHRSRAFSQSGIYIMADPARAPEQVQAVLDAGPHGSLSGGHGHADALSLHLAANGRELLLDPGTYRYASSGMPFGKVRNRFRGTAAHNTLQVANCDQTEPKSAFSWGAFAKTQVEFWESGAGFELFRGQHCGYRRLREPVVHRRWVFHLHSQFWLVRDVALGQGEPRLDLFWHIGPGFLPLQEHPGSVLFEDASGFRFALITPEDSSWERTIENGWWSPAYGKKEPAAVVHLHRQSSLPAEQHSLLFVPRHEADVPGRLVAAGSDFSQSSIRVCTYESSSQVKDPQAGNVQTHCMIFSESPQTWVREDGRHAGRIESDARFVYCGFDDERRLQHWILCEGSFLTLDGKPLFPSDGMVASKEWLAEKGSQTPVAAGAAGERSGTQPIRSPR